MPKVFISPFKGGTTSVGKALDMAGFKTDIRIPVDRHEILGEKDAELVNTLNYFLESFFSFAQISKQMSLDIEKLLGDKIRYIAGDVDVFQDVPMGHEMIHPYIKKIVFPDCKFVFLERDRGPYAASVKNHLNKCVSGRLGYLLALKYSYCKEMIRVCPEFLDTISWSNYKRWKSRYVDLSRLFPDDVLFMKVTEGWGPLCQFLDFEAPDVAFPWENKSSPDSI